MDSILFIAPHKEIAKNAKKVIAKMNLSIPVIVARNIDAIDKAKNSNASVIISRGGTSRDLRRNVNKIIVDVSITFADIFPSIEKLSKMGSKKIIIISNNHILGRNNINLKINDTSITSYPYINDEEAEVIIKKLMTKNIDGIIGDIRPIELAQKYNIKNCLFIQSNELAISKAIEEALSIVETQQRKQLRLQTLQSIIDNIDEGVIVYNKNKKPIFSNKIGQQILDNNLTLSGKKGTNNLNNYLDNHTDKIVDINNEKMLLNVIKLNLDNEINNDVLIFQKVNTIEKNTYKIQTTLYKRGLYAKKTFDDIIYTSPQMHKILDTAKQFAKSKSTILIYGETGTGKEGLAQSIHNASLRANKPFVSVNCASLPPTLIESELFGYVDGAFTGARRNGKKGLFELAHTGTIFLDEIGDLPLDIQSRLLRVLQEREIMRIGDDRILPIDIRLICATNKNLKQLIKEGKFRQDLYYRINVLRLTLPPLRKRSEDIMPLMDFYLNKYSKENKTITLSDEIKQYLIKYPWYGNVRELKNIAEVLAFLYKDGLTLKDIKNILDEDDISSSSFMPDKDTLTISLHEQNNLKSIEKNIIHQLVEKNYSTNEICKLLGISKVTLWRKSK